MVCDYKAEVTWKCLIKQINNLLLPNSCYNKICIRVNCQIIRRERNDEMSLILLEQLKPQISELLTDIVDLRDSL